MVFINLFTFSLSLMNIFKIATLKSLSHASAEFHFSGLIAMGILASRGVLPGLLMFVILHLDLGIWSYDVLGVHIWPCPYWMGVPLFGYCLLWLQCNILAMKFLVQCFCRSVNDTKEWKWARKKGWDGQQERGTRVCSKRERLQGVEVGWEKWLLQAGCSRVRSQSRD